MSKIEKKLLFEYSKLNSKHTTVVEEVIKLAREKDLNDFANQLEVAFKIKQRPVFSLDNSIFCKYAKRLNINITPQGVLTTNNPDEPDYPIIGPMDDVRKFDALVALAIKENSSN